MALDAIKKRGEKKSSMVSGLLLGSCGLALLVLLAALAVFVCDRVRPAVALSPSAAYLGGERQIGITAADSASGLRSIRVSLVQGDKRAQVFEKQFPRKGYFSGAGPLKAEEYFPVAVKALGFQEGKAQLLVQVTDFSFWGWGKGNTRSFAQEVSIDTKAPLIGISESPEFIKGGGAGVIVYRANEALGRHGVMINGFFHPGFALPKRGKNLYGACIGLPFDIAAIETSFVSATDLAGNEARVPFRMNLHVRNIISDQISVSDGFLAAKLPEFAAHYPELSGTPIEQYLVVNNRIRAENNRKIQEICARSHSERLWEGRFLRMAASSPRAGFADRRTYLYNGQAIDEQVHLGVDLASLERAEVEAANHGIVVFADYLGIYGNMVILDHGQGVFSLYSHLSEISATVGSKVAKGSVIGRSGTSGLAGGDHLHFSILVNGVFVDPIEWWDEEWLRLHMLSSL